MESLTCRVDVTPNEAIPLFGLADRFEPSAGVASRLEANVLGLRDSESDVPTYIVTLDLLYGGELTELLAEALDLPESRVLVCGSHTHFAPGVDSELAGLGPTDVQYVRWVAARIAEAIRVGIWTGAPRMAFAVGSADALFVNRRQPILGFGLPLPRIGRVVLAPHRAGLIDPSIHVVAVTAGSETIAVIWSVACHPVCSPREDKVSACFPGHVRESIRAEVGDVPVLFLQGFSGDVQPHSESRVPPIKFRRLVGYLLAGLRRFSPQTQAKYDAWCRRLSSAVVASLRQAVATDGELIDMDLRTASATRTPAWSRPPTAILLGLTKSLALFLVNAEVVSQRTRELADRMQPRHVVPVGCVGSVLGYWPTDVMSREGGYEGCTSRRFFPPVDWTSAGGPDAVWNDLVDVLAEHASAGGPHPEGGKGSAVAEV